MSAFQELLSTFNTLRQANDLIQERLAALSDQVTKVRLQVTLEYQRDSRFGARLILHMVSKNRGATRINPARVMHFLLHQILWLLFFLQINIQEVERRIQELDGRTQHIPVLEDKLVRAHEGGS